MPMAPPVALRFRGGWVALQGFEKSHYDKEIQLFAIYPDDYGNINPKPLNTIFTHNYGNLV